MLRVVTDDDARAELRSAFDEIVLDGARRMLAAALEAEVDAYIAELARECDGHGQRLVVRNGHAEPRTITTAAGRFRSSILSPWARKSPKGGRGAVVDVPARDEQRRLRPGAGRVLRLHRRTERLGDHPARHPVAGRGPRLRRNGGRTTATSSTCGPPGFHFNVRLEEDRVCALVIVGMRADGTKELVAITDGYRESTERQQQGQEAVA